MSSGISLTASMRSNLLSLQNTQKLFDTTQERLSTGKKVNSALDNPTSYFTAQSLTKRADDLSGLLDSMGQAVQTITAADQGLTTLNTLVDQATSLVNSALDTANTGSYLVGGSEISAYDNLLDLGSIAADDTLTIRTGQADELTSETVLTADQTITLAADAVFTLQSAEGGVIATATVDAGDYTVEEIMTAIEDGLGYNENGENRVQVELNEGKMTISSVDKNFSLLAAGGASELGFDLGTTITIPAASAMANTDSVSGTSTAAAAVVFEYNGTEMTTESLAIGATAQTVADAIAATIEETTGQTVDVKTVTGGIAADGGTLSITSAGAGLTLGDPLQGVSVKSFMDQINSQVEGVTASINDAGKLVITSETGADLVIQDSTGSVAQDLGIKGVSTNGSEIRATYAEQFNDVMTQINEIVGNDDTGYKGVNLLNGDSLTVNFNETRTSTLTVEGRVMNTQGLGLSQVGNEWVEADDIQTSLRQVESAAIRIEEFSSELGQNLSVVQTRQDFTENMVNILTTGADDLTLADMNEEAANMLALQTRQQLATNALSLSSQSAQSVLSLF